MSLRDIFYGETFVRTTGRVLIVGAWMRSTLRVPL